MKYILVPSLFVLLFSCKGKESSQAKTETSDSVTVVTDSMASGGRSVTTATGRQIIVIEEHPIGMSLSDIKVAGAGMGDTLLFKDADPVSDVLKGDLDKDGFDEVYIITTTAGSGSYGKVIGLASLKDSALQVISIPAFDDQAKPMEGYMGGDLFSIQGTELVRTFTLMKVDGTKAAENTSISYSLIKKGTNFLLLEGKR
jgi:hypothetical protein